MITKKFKIEMIISLTGEESLIDKIVQVNMDAISKADGIVEDCDGVEVKTVSTSFKEITNDAA